MERGKGHQYYTVAEAARELAVSQATIWRWIAAEKLPAYRVGPRRLRIHKQDLERVVAPVGTREVTMVEETEEKRSALFAGYDAQRVQAALRASAGALAGVDRQALLADIQAARAQVGEGRPA